ncbi:HVO_2922 family protein [Halarchaeum acidiphilum]|nr:HVO_2922 family protein [Halarchaeum acidiphilum]
MSDATFEVFTDAAGQWRWHLIHDNGNIIADSGEGYASRQKAEQGIESVKRNAPDAEIVRIDESS